METDLFYAGGRTDGRADMTELIVAFRYCATASRKYTNINFVSQQLWSRYFSLRQKYSDCELHSSAYRKVQCVVCYCCVSFFVCDVRNCKQNAPIYKISLASVPFTTYYTKSIKGEAERQTRISENFRNVVIKPQQFHFKQLKT